MPNMATDPLKTLVNTDTGNCWGSNLQTTNQRFHIDYGTAFAADKIYYENFHSSGSFTNQGAKNFTLWGSNSSSDFNDLTYANNGTWVQLTTSVSQFDQHVAANTTDPKYITVTNTIPYRYYAFKFADNWGGSYLSLRRVELQSHSIGQTIGASIFCKGNQVSGITQIETIAPNNTDWNELTLTLNPTVNGVVEIEGRGWYVTGNGNIYFADCSISST
jgi:hypothetical protein